ARPRGPLTLASTPLLRLNATFGSDLLRAGANHPGQRRRFQGNRENTADNHPPIPTPSGEPPQHADHCRCPYEHAYDGHSQADVLLTPAQHMPDRPTDDTTARTTEENREYTPKYTRYRIHRAASPRGRTTSST